MTLGDCLSLPQGFIHVYDHYFQTSSSLKPLGQSMPNSMWSLLGKGNESLNSQGHVINMTAMPKYGQNILLQNQESYYLETWHVALGTQAL